MSAIIGATGWRRIYRVPAHGLPFLRRCSAYPQATNVSRRRVCDSLRRSDGRRRLKSAMSNANAQSSRWWNQPWTNHCSPDLDGIRTTMPKFVCKRGEDEFSH